MSRLKQTRALARAFTRLDKAAQRYEDEKRAFDVAFGPWSAGRVINRDEAREHLVSTGFLESGRR